MPVVSDHDRHLCLMATKTCVNSCCHIYFCRNITKRPNNNANRKNLTKDLTSGKKNSLKTCKNVLIHGIDTNSMLKNLFPGVQMIYNCPAN